MFANPQTALAESILQACRDRQLRLGIAESCTGGLLTACLTAVAGSSDVLDRGFIVYQNQAKADLLGVSEDLLARKGAVNEPVARAMAEGVLSHAPVDASVAITGIAGPGGGSDTKPVGLVYFAAARRGHTTQCQRHVFDGDRQQVRDQSVTVALRMLEQIVTSPDDVSAP